ncbi:potassium channel AKT1-like [Quillaja saponaria]|uniref:Potassium channel AKT1-like n=1 Tax=Quillaja saponaria TaxID=32244 RepID=A0AAD7LIG9_QUISA|nr:potassium channel AKT1-like [Quillaja saponaria]
MWTNRRKSKMFNGTLCGRGEKEVEVEIEQMSKDEGSQYSLMAGILPALGSNARSTRKMLLRPFIISPFNPRYNMGLSMKHGYSKIAKEPVPGAYRVPGRVGDALVEDRPIGQLKVEDRSIGLLKVEVQAVEG